MYEVSIRDENFINTFLSNESTFTDINILSVIIDSDNPIYDIKNEDKVL